MMTGPNHDALRACEKVTWTKSYPIFWPHLNAPQSKTP